MRWFRKHRHGLERASDIMLFAMALLGFALSVVNTVIKNDTGEPSMPLLIAFYAAMALAFISFVTGMLLHRYNRKVDRLKIHTHNIAANLVDLFEEVLDEHDITIPDEAREGNEDEARIYGKVYDDLLYKTEISLVATISCIDGNYEIVPDVFE